MQSLLLTAPFRQIEGLEIDGAAATPENLVDDGPVELAMEILGRIKSECGMTEDERKN